MDVLRQIDCLREEGLTVSGVVITLFNEQASAKTFAQRLINRNERVYFHKFTKGYPTDIETIASFFTSMRFITFPFFQRAMICTQKCADLSALLPVWTILDSKIYGSRLIHKAGRTATSS